MLTKAHIKYLESRLITLARKANTSYLDNSNTPKGARLSEADISDMEYFIDQIRLILPAVGLNTLVEATPHISLPVQPIDNKTTYYIKSKLIKATMIETDEGFIVKAGFQASIKTSNSIAEGWLRIRKKLIEAEILKQHDQHLIFIEDASFTSPSAAASVVLGRQAPRPISWINSSGQTYKQIQDELPISK